MKYITIIGILIMSLNTYAQSPKEDLVKQLFSITKTDQMAPALVGTIINNFKKNNTAIPQNYWDEIKKSVSYSDFNTKVTGIYLNNYTEQELTELIELYHSQSMTLYKEKSKKVEGQLYQLGSEFGRDTAQKILAKLQAYKV